MTFPAKSNLRKEIFEVSMSIYFHNLFQIFIETGYATQMYEIKSRGEEIHHAIALEHGEREDRQQKSIESKGGN